MCYSDQLIDNDLSPPLPQGLCRTLADCRCALRTHNVAPESQAFKYITMLAYKIGREVHMNQWLQVACEAMADQTAPLEDELRKPFIKLLNSLEAREAAFTPQQRQHMGVWKLLVFLRLQLFTDDSFIFNKVTRNIQVCLLLLKVSTSGLHAAITNCFALLSFAVTCRPAQVLV